MNLVDKKNIGILVYGRFPTEKAYGSHLIEIAKAFRDKGGNVTVFYSKTYNSKTIFTTPDSYYGNCERINFKELKNIDFTNSPLFLRLPSSIQKLIWNFGAIYWSFSIKKYLKNQDFLWSTNPNILVPLTKLKSVIIYEKHGAAKYIQKLSIKYIASYEKTILVGTTKKSYEELSSIRSKNKSIYLPNGVNLSEYKQIEKNKNHIINIGYIGMLETYGKGKGVEEAINKLIEISKNRKILITVIGRAGRKNIKNSFSINRK